LLGQRRQAYGRDLTIRRICARQVFLSWQQYANLLDLADRRRRGNWAGHHAADYRQYAAVCSAQSGEYAELSGPILCGHEQLEGWIVAPLE
jgi:hypothetical protein